MCRLGLDDDFVKVLDFGLVKHVDRPRGTMLTMDGSTAGTPAYMAPEIALGHQAIDGRADIYSLGCLAYFLLTGQPVFVADTAIATALAHVNDEPIPPSLRSEFEIPSALEALILQCLAKNPAHRPTSVGELAQRLSASVSAPAWTAIRTHCGNATPGVPRRRRRSLHRDNVSHSTARGSGREWPQPAQQGSCDAMTIIIRSPACGPP